MPLLNFTTEVPADRTINEIQKCLATHGAKAILNEYDDNGYIVALSFKIAPERDRFSPAQRLETGPADFGA